MWSNATAQHFISWNIEWELLAHALSGKIFVRVIVHSLSRILAKHWVIAILKVVSTHSIARLPIPPYWRTLPRGRPYYKFCSTDIFDNSSAFAYRINTFLTFCRRVLKDLQTTLDLRKSCMSRYVIEEKTIRSRIWNCTCCACNRTTDEATNGLRKTKLARSWWTTVTMSASPIVILYSKAAMSACSVFCHYKPLHYVFLFPMVDRGGRQRYHGENLTMT